MKSSDQLPLRKSVLYICPNGFLGGAERFILEICKGHLQNKRYQPFVVIFKDGVVVKLLREMGVNVFVPSFPIRLSKPLSVIKAARFIRKIIFNHKIEIIHATMPYSQIFSSLSCFGLKIKKVWFQHGPVGGTLDYVANYFLADVIYYNSDFTLKKQFTIPGFNFNAKYVYIPYSIVDDVVTNQELAEVEQLYPIDKAKIKIGLVGRICEQKGQDIFVRAISEYLKSNDPHRVHFYIIGSALLPAHQQFEQQIKDLCHELGVWDHLTFIPHQNKVSVYLRWLDILVCPFRYPEPFGMMVGEGMVQHCLVATTGHGGVLDMFRDGETAYAVDPQNQVGGFSEIFKKLVQLINNNPNEVQRVCDSARSSILSNFNVVKMTQKIESSYDDLFSINS